MNDTFRMSFAHSREGRPPEEWQSLEDHLRNVAKCAAEFARPFGGAEWARIAGLWHDLGKYSDAFQKKLYDANGIECHLETLPGKVIHSEAGGHLAQMRFHPPEFAAIFCWLIMGHHAGLADYSSADSGARALEPKMRDTDQSTDILDRVPDNIKDQSLPPLDALKKGTDISFFIRMIFSCLVDADFLDTEAFMDRGKARLRSVERPGIPELLESFTAHMDCLSRKAPETDVNGLRADVLAQCRAAAEREPSVFSLTVPTGGGKTLASMAFALRHAAKWSKRRIIYVIPFTSIIEQTANVFRDIPGFQDAVLEHHCNVMDDDETRETRRARLAAENWDMPIIVTTSVQFFESLYACRTSRCRKLHNIADSVVIFDEAQYLPPAYLRPAVFAIRELQRHYGVTPVLCTATQPVLTQTESFDFKFREGFESVHEIVAEPAALFRRLRRVRLSLLDDLDPVDLDRLAEAVQAEGTSVLCIVNRKPEARELAKRLPAENTVHLSTNLCAKHRLHVLGTIRKRLAGGESILVVSTSLVEAGVDLDFPVVYRALAGLDSIAQAAGRCNREGRLASGKTVVFVPLEQPDYVRSAAAQARPFLAPERLDAVFDPDTFTEYFRNRFFLLGAERLDEKRVLERLSGRLENFAFRSVAEDFRLIDDAWQRRLIVPYGDALELVDRLLEWDARSVLRRLQRYTVAVPVRIMNQLVDEGHARELPGFPGLYHLDNHGLYTEDFGFVPPDAMDAYKSDLTII